MDYRLDRVEIPRLKQLEGDCNWFQLHQVFGRGIMRLLDLDLRVQAFAWRLQDIEPVPNAGPWHVQIALGNGMLAQPMVRIVPSAAGFVPASGNISDWTEGSEIPAGLVCYSSRWDPTRHTLAWVVHQVARIISGEVFHLEASPLSRRGRDWQAQALTLGWLPACILPPVSAELLFLCAPSEALHGPCCEGIEFDVF
ncbi:MAG: hypothetical protein QUV05_21665 [Phycisphaerae bacterium]|nr:hypothetical protein [Phycisphaerae bacterium]